MYPLKFENIYFEKIWGGRDLSIFRDNLPDGNIGESWDIACHENGTSIIANGKYKGLSLTELIGIEKEKLLGNKIQSDWFPLLIKLINSKSNLSVQVHPNDEYAKVVEGEMGKTEVWYVVEANEDANIIIGTKNCTKEQFRKAIEEGNLENHMNKIPVKKGDIYYVKSGLIHAIGEGLIIAEIQQNSDTTYRVYDYNRGRELHIDKALDVVDLNLECKKSEGLTVFKDGYSKTSYCISKDFLLEKYNIKTSLEEESDIDRFYIFTCVEGKGIIKYNNGKESIKKGDSILIPATLGKYKITGNLEILKSYVPDVSESESKLLSVVSY